MNAVPATEQLAATCAADGELHGARRHCTGSLAVEFAEHLLRILDTIRSDS